MLGLCEARTSLRRQLRFLPNRRRSGIRRYRRTSNKRIRLRMRRAARLQRVFLCRGNLHNSRRRGSHSYGKSGWSCRTSHHFSAILIQDLAFVKRRGLAVVGKFDRCRVLVGQALLPVRVRCGDIVPDSQECLSYPAT